MNIVDLSFPARGGVVPLDHGYALYGAISRALPSAHGAAWLGIHGLEGRLVAPDALDVQRGALTLRLPSERIGEVLGLAGATLELARDKIVLGAPVVRALVPAASLDARLVAIRLTGGVARPLATSDLTGRFEAEAKRQLERIGVAGDLVLSGRRSITVGGRRVVGHAVRVVGLSPEHSLVLQVEGLGGKRRMGCGLFRPARLRAQRADNGSAGA